MKKIITIFTALTLVASVASADGKQQRSYDNMFGFITAAAALGALILAGEAYAISKEGQEKRQNALTLQKEMNQPIKKVETIVLPAKKVEVEPVPTPKDDGFKAIEVGGYGNKRDFSKPTVVYKSSDGEKVDPKNNKLHNYDEQQFGAPLLRQQKQPNVPLTIKLKGTK